MQLALFYAEAGEMDQTFHHLNRGLEDHDPGLVHLAVAPQWDSLRADPRSNQCLIRMRLQDRAAARDQGKDKTTG